MVHASRTRSFTSEKSAIRPKATGRTASDQLEQDHLGRIRPARAQLEDARVAARPLRVARGDLLEQLVDHELVLAEARHRLPASVLIAALGERDQPLQVRLDRLGLGLSGLNPLMRAHLSGETHQQRLAVRGAATELSAVLLVAHEACECTKTG